MKYKEDNIILRKSFLFALDVIDFTEELQQLKKFNLSGQLFRSGTSIGANVCESQNAESLNDFIHKLKLAAKEVEETIYWLSLCNESKHLPNNYSLIDKAIELRKILTRIIASCKSKKSNAKKI
jgi:four helix bundle protein